MRNIVKLFICFSFISLLTGCGSDFSCSKKYNENVNYKVKVSFDVDNKKNVISSLAVFTFERSDDANNFCEIEKVLGDNSKITCTNKTVRINNYHQMLSDDKKISENEMLNILKKDNFKC